MDILESNGQVIKYGDLMISKDLHTHMGLTLIAQISGASGVEYQMISLPDGNRWNETNVRGMTIKQTTKEIKCSNNTRILTEKEKIAFRKMIENFINTLA